MASLLDSVDMRTQLAGHNRLELLLFRLGGKQVYGINVFKVQEVIQCPELIHLPKSHHVITGIAHLRGKTIAIMDLGQAINNQGVQSIEESYVVISEYNRATQGFLVGSVERIVNLNWDDVLPPPKGSGKNNYLTAVTHIDDVMVEIIDVEKVLADVMGVDENMNAELENKTRAQTEQCKYPRHVLVVDDSSVARNQVKRVLEKVGFEVTTANDGQYGLEQLQAWTEEGPIHEKLALVISDVEMPRMDGYTLTTSLRQIPELADLYVILHTSLSGVFNNSMVEKVGADKFVAKFKPNELASAVLEFVEGSSVDDQ